MPPASCSRPSLAAARTRYSELAAKRDEIAQRCAGLQDAEAALTAAQDQLKKSQANLREWQAKVAAAAASEAAAGEIAAIGEDLERLDAQRKAKDDELQRAAADAEARLKDLGAQLIKINDDYAAKRAEIDRDRADLPPVTEAGVDLSGAQRELEAANTQLDAAESDIADLTNRLATLRARLAQVQEQMRGAEVARQEAAALTDDIAQWRLLAKALGRDGVVALSIDDAGPTISGIANDLLLSCYGPRFSIRFDTQAEKKDGSMKETFDIRVFDAERGDDKSVSKMSGGERIYINEALTRAIGLFHAQALGQAYTCLFSDESDGALDPERKQHYMAMKRRVLEIGGYSTEFYITHTPELWEMADSTVDVWGMRVTP
jgi:DNA repair protein SbcC/Rad50